MAGSCQVLCHLVGDLLRDTLWDTTVQVQEEEEVGQKPAKYTGGLHTLPLLKSWQKFQALSIQEGTENDEIGSIVRQKN